MLNAVNPYIAGSPVTGPEMFFGREDVFTFIRQALIGKHRDNIIVLYGQRRTGKTSTLYQLPSHLGPHYLCVFVDLQALHLEGIDGFLWELANHIQRTLQREHQIELPHLEHQEFMADARNFFQYKFLDQVWSAIGDRHLLLMLDEAIRLEEQVRTGKLEHQIFEYMSHLMQHYEQLNFLFSLGSGLEEMEKEYTLLFRTAVYKKISFLDRDAANALIINPVKDYYEVEHAAAERILQITSGHPYCIQLLCHNLFNRWQQHPAELVTVQDVEQVLDEAVERGLAVFKHIWEEATSAEKAVIAAISKITGNASAPVSTDSINQAWKSYKVRIPQGEMAQALKNLIARDVIKGTDTYVFCVDLQRLWIQKYRRFDWVAEEIAETMHAWATAGQSRILPTNYGPQPYGQSPYQQPLNLYEQNPYTVSNPQTINMPQQQPSPPPPPPRRQDKIWPIIGILTLVLILVSSTSIFVLFAQRATTNTTTKTVTPTATIPTPETTNTTTKTVTPTATIPTPETKLPYPPYNGTLVLNDPLRDNSKGYNWQDDTDTTPPSCSFARGAYHAKVNSGHYHPCTAQTTDFNNSIYEVQMTITQGDCGALIFRNDSANNNFYYFRVCQEGTSALFIYKDKKGSTLGSDHSNTAIHTGLNQSNLIAVVAQGSTFDLYVNQQKFDSISDSIYSHGHIGVAAEGFSGDYPLTEVVFSNAKVWKL